MLLQSYHAAKQLYNITEQQSSIAYTFAACTMSPSNCTINHINIIALHIMPLQPVPCRQATWGSIVGLQRAGQTWGGAATTKKTYFFAHLKTKRQKWEEENSQFGLRWRSLPAEVGCYIDKLAIRSLLHRCWWLVYDMSWVWLVARPYVFIGD